ncbi:exosome complex component Rrp4 isoform X2 [Lycorma delicatula]|uniref:exosome complex component Rrp4 isoform X2 n=1 Tax=Lycorma delicatula TaxID=130591 RepID=UPI003F5195A0
MSQSGLIRLASARVNSILNSGNEPPMLYTPGQVIPQEGCMSGHGTYFEHSIAAEPSELRASVAGVMERVNKLILVKPLKARYYGEVGDVVVGRITEVQQKRWKVDTNSRLDSLLLLSSVNLLGGELRRRSVEDEKMMRKYLTEGDLVSAEVQTIHSSDGTLLLHARSLKYGKLSQGVLVKVYPGLIKRCKTHFQKLACGVSLILGNNGFIWIYPTSDSNEDEGGGFVQNLDKVSELLVPETMFEVAISTQGRLNLHEED